MITRIKGKRYWAIAIVLIVVGVLLLLLRGDEDRWAQDSEGNWQKHGNPAIQDFEACAKKYPVMESYPEQCAIPNGPSFTKQY